jgi:hypothetical protein
MAQVCEHTAARAQPASSLLSAPVERDWKAASFETIEGDRPRTAPARATALEVWEADRDGERRLARAIKRLARV